MLRCPRALKSAKWCLEVKGRGFLASDKQRGPGVSPVLDMEVFKYLSGLPKSMAPL